MNPRVYQQQSIASIQLNKVNLLVLPQRSGKSFVMKLAIDRFNFKKVLIIVGYRKIVEQLASYFPHTHTHILAGKPFDNTKQVHLGSFQTLANRDIDLSQYDAIFQDEAHSRTSTKALNVVMQPNATVLLFTGTPLTNSNKLMVKNIDNRIQPTSPKELIDNQWLAPTKFLSNGSILGDNAQELLNKRQDFDEDMVKQVIKKEDLLQSILSLIESEELDTKHKTLIYVNFISTAEELYELIKHRNNVAMIHSKMSNKEQSLAIEHYQQSDSGILINIRSLSLGFDSPTTDRLILAVLSKIDSLVLQILWRASTINPKQPNKVAKVYDMIGVLTGKLNPYTDFSSYSKKLSCKDNCVKEFPTDQLQQYFCLESCKGGGPLTICDGQLSSSLVDNPFISDFMVIEGTPCKEAVPVWNMQYTTKEAGFGKLHKYSKCTCGCITQYTVTTVVAPSEMIEVYNDDPANISNVITVLFSREHKKAIAILDDITKKRFKIVFFNSSEEMYSGALKFFNNKSFSVLSNIAMPKLANVSVDRSLDNSLYLVKWESESTSGFIKELIRYRIGAIASFFGMKPGWVYYAIRGIDKDNEKTILQFLSTPDLQRNAFISYFSRLNK